MWIVATLYCSGKSLCVQYRGDHPRQNIWFLVVHSVDGESAGAEGRRQLHGGGQLSFQWVSRVVQVGGVTCRRGWGALTASGYSWVTQRRGWEEGGASTESPEDISGREKDPLAQNNKECTLSPQRFPRGWNRRPKSQRICMCVLRSHKLWKVVSMRKHEDSGFTE